MDISTLDMILCIPATILSYLLWKKLDEKIGFVRHELMILVILTLTAYRHSVSYEYYAAIVLFYVALTETSRTLDRKLIETSEELTSLHEHTKIHTDLALKWSCEFISGYPIKEDCPNDHDPMFKTHCENGKDEASCSGCWEDYFKDVCQD